MPQYGVSHKQVEFSPIPKTTLFQNLQIAPADRSISKRSIDFNGMFEVPTHEVRCGKRICKIQKITG